MRSSSMLKEYTRLLKQLRASVRPENRIKGIRSTIDHRSPTIVLRDFWCQHSYARAAQRFPYADFSGIRDFALFPLQYQPEATIDVVSPRFNNQIETARQIAMALPDDMVLVVKDHPAMAGLRPPSYLEKLARTPNVKLIDWRIPSNEILRSASMVVSPGGTILAEAAFLAVPGIQLGELGTTKQLPNVFYHTDLSTMTRKIKETFSVDLGGSDYYRMLVNYVAAAYDSSIGVDYYSIWDGHDGNFDVLYAAYAKTVDSLLNSGEHPMETAMQSS